EPAPSPVALERVGRVGDQLELFEHELRDDKGAVEETGLADVGDAGGDDDTGVEDAVAPLRPGRPEQPDDTRWLEPLAVAPAHQQADVRRRGAGERLGGAHR